MRQAAELAERAREHDFAALWSSPLLRARETADIVAARVGLEAVEDPRLVETDAGDWTDRPSPRCAAEAQRALRRVRRRRPGLRLPRRRVLRRTGAARLRRAGARSNAVRLPALVVCHGMVIRAALACAPGTA